MFAVRGTMSFPVACSPCDGDPTGELAEDLIGWYEFHWSRGSFPVCIRPAGYFFCPQFPALARGKRIGLTLEIEWGRYGRYALAALPGTKGLVGHEVPKSDLETNWRRAEFIRPLNAVELAILCNGHGSESLYKRQR